MQYTSIFDKTEFNFNNNENNAINMTLQNENYFSPSVISTPQQQSSKIKHNENSTHIDSTSQIQELRSEISIDSQTSFPTIHQHKQFTQQSSDKMAHISIVLPPNIPKEQISTTYIAIPVNLSSQASTTTESLNQNHEILDTEIDLRRFTSDNDQNNLSQAKKHINKNDNKLKKKKRKQDGRLSLSSNIKLSYRKKYEQLKYLQFNETNYEQFDENHLGFTNYQRQILDQQMRIHVQFCVQNFIQTYSHPELWKLAQSQKDMLLKLNELSKNDIKSAFNAWNLKLGLELIKKWENELSIYSEENRSLMDFFYNEIERIQNLKRPSISNAMRFPPRIMKLMIESKVFIYPELLPKIPFHFHKNHLKIRNNFCPSEDHILAFAMEKYFQEINNEKLTTSSIDPRICDLRKVCEKITTNLIKCKSWRSIFGYIKSCRDKKTSYNPIKVSYRKYII